MEGQKALYPNPARPPKKYPQKDLHGRVRGGSLYYRDFRRFQSFCINVFGWDMFEAPESVGGEKAGSEHPTLLIATGPSQYDYEGLTGGHILISGRWAPDGALPSIMMEMHSDPDIDPSDTLREIAEHGGRVLFDNSKEPGIQPWARAFIVEDPCGNKLNLWKCSASRTWDELETQRDAEE